MKYDDQAYTTDFMERLVQKMVNAMKHPIYCRLSLQIIRPENIDVRIMLVLIALRVFKEMKVEVSI